jgi:hypothetical protein
MGMIVAFNPVDKASAMVSLFKSSVEIEDMDVPRRVVIKPLQGADAKARGEELARLLGRHRPTKQAIDQALGVDADTAPSTIYFRLAMPAADALPWEQLYVEPRGFVALDARWPIARVARRVHEVAQRTFEAPLRIVAVLSAADRDGVPQLDALATAIVAARLQGLAVGVHVITGDPAVTARVEELADPGVTVETIATDPVAVVRQIAAARPHLLHVLCHGGYAAPGVMGLSFATRRDFLSRAKVGRVAVSVDMVAAAFKREDQGEGPWLVVLAACETANAAAAPSTAHELVNSGVPAVIGMRRVVDLSATDAFCTRVYPELLAMVAAAVAAADGSPHHRIEWAPALTAPRLAAAGGEPASEDGWSDPVLYVQQEHLLVYTPAAADPHARERAALRDRLAEYELFAKTLDPRSTPKEIIATVTKEITRLRKALSEVEA